MDLWKTGVQLNNSGAFGLARSAAGALGDTQLAQVFSVKKALQLAVENGDGASGSLVEVLLAASDGDVVTLESCLRHVPQMKDSYYPDESHGATPLVMAVCFGHIGAVESILALGADPDLPDTLLHYTPLMWAVHCENLDMVKALLNEGADPFAPGEKNAVSLLTPNHPLYEYFATHNLLGKQEDPELFESRDFVPNDVQFDDLSTRIKLSLTVEEDPQPEEDEEDVLARETTLAQEPDFEYEKLLPSQYIKFTDSDIPSLLDYIFGLRQNVTYQHDTKATAAIIFQLVRYSHLKVDSSELTQFLFDCFITRLRTVTNTKSGVFNMIIQDDLSSVGGAGDIVLLSYWMSVIQFLHFFFAKSNIYKAYPSFLQELINVIQSLISTLSFSINSRLNLLAEDCLLNFTNLVDVSNVLYAKDWNLFKSKKNLPNTYDDIYNMLYPPTQTELMKPSPLKYIQTLGALDYVLNLHDVNNLIRFQCFSQVFYYVNSILFNKIIGSWRYLARSKAIQIRLNISAIEDWLRSHNYKMFKPDKIGHLHDLLPSEDTKLTNLLLESESDHKHPGNLIFLYNSIYHIGKVQLQPTIELLQFLQVMSSLADEENFINIINQFDYLNYFQILKVVKNYRYEVDEHKLPKAIVNFMKRLVSERGEESAENIDLNYMIQGKLLSKEYNIYINPNYVYPVALPNLTELINVYGSGLGGLKVLRAKKFQPSLPIEIVDDIDELLTKNKNEYNDTYDYDKDQEEDDEEDEEPRVKHDNVDIFKGDELFKQVQLPGSLAHKNWGDDEIQNPW